MHSGYVQGDTDPDGSNSVPIAATFDPQLIASLAPLTLRRQSCRCLPGMSARGSRLCAPFGIRSRPTSSAYTCSEESPPGRPTAQPVSRWSSSTVEVKVRDEASPQQGRHSRSRRADAAGLASGSATKVPSSRSGLTAPNPASTIPARPSRSAQRFPTRSSLFPTRCPACRSPPASAWTLSRDGDLTAALGIYQRSTPTPARPRSPPSRASRTPLPAIGQSWRRAWSEVIRSRLPCRRSRSSPTLPLPLLALPPSPHPLALPLRSGGRLVGPPHAPHSRRSPHQVACFAAACALACALSLSESRRARRRP